MMYAADLEWNAEYKVQDDGAIQYYMWKWTSQVDAKC